MSRLVAVVGPTATGKSSLGIAIARAIGGEIIACDSTAVYRGIDIGTDKVPEAEQGGIPHHLIDIVEPTDVYSAARYATDAARMARAIAARGRVPVLVGGTGLYYRALVRGLFPGPARDEALRARLERIADRRGLETLYRWLARVDAPSATRIQPRDRRRIVRALEVYLLTGTPLTVHFERTTSPIAGMEVVTVGLRLEREVLRPRITSRVDTQLARGVVDEVRSLIAAGVPGSAQVFSGLVYRQVVEMLDGVRDEAATRELIIRENMHYARRQLVWFRSEPVDRWIDRPGETPEALAEAMALIGGAPQRE